MRARIKFTTDFVEDSLVGILKEHHWWPHFEQSSHDAQVLISEIKDSVQEGDVGLFMGSRKFVLSHTGTESKGTLSHEHQVWVLRILNPSIHLLQLACQVFVAHIVDNAVRNNKKIAFLGPIQIVERQRKETIIEGQTLATPKDRVAYARSHRGMEFWIGVVGTVALLVLLIVTYPWPFRDFSNQKQTWAFSIFEKFIGSVLVTTLISIAQYTSFKRSLRESTVRWSIPGEPEKHDVQAHT